MIKQLQKPKIFTKRKDVGINYVIDSFKKFMEKLPYERNNYSESERINLVVAMQSSQLSIDEIISKTGITPDIFQKWTDEFLNLNDDIVDEFTEGNKNFSLEEKFEIVLEGKAGKTSVEELCNETGISHDTFLKWSKLFSENAKVELEQTKEGKLIYRKNKRIIIDNVGKEVFDYFETYVNFRDELIEINAKSKDYSIQESTIDFFINLSNVNDERYLNKYFEKVNANLNDGGLYIGCLETFSARRKRMERKNLKLLNNLYFSMEFFFKRILPKLSFTKKYYFDI